MGLSVALVNGGNSHRSREPRMHRNQGIPTLYLDQSITKRWYQPIENHVLHLIDSPIAARRGLCSSLYEARTPQAAAQVSPGDQLTLHSTVFYTQLVKMVKHRISNAICPYFSHYCRNSFLSLELTDRVYFFLSGVKGNNNQGGLSKMGK